jgi:tetratricopeptide (TPR) repeat protein
MSGPSVFISYSHKDEEWKDRLKPHLGMLEKDGRLTIWDDRSIDGGATWYPEIKRAMERAAVAICLISADFLNSDFCRKEEIPYLLKRRENEGMLLLPILIRPCFWDAFDWLKAIQMLPRDGKAVSKDFKEDWDTPFDEVAREVNSFLAKPTREAVAPPPTPRWSPPKKVDVDRLPVTGAELFGRQNELRILDEAWETSKTNVISFVAWGGVGKSTLINKWREQLAADNYRGAKRVFAWSFYSQGTGERVTSADIFIAEALKWFGDSEMANSNASPWDKGGRLAELMGREKTLLLLDGMESLQSSLDFERGKIKDPALAVLVTELVKDNPGLCVITTREPVIDLADFPETAREIDLEQISAEAGRALLRVGGVQGTDAELEAAARDFGLHALALNLLAAYIYEIPGHHVSNAAEIPDIDVPLKEGKHPRRVMAAFEKRFGEDSAEVETLRVLGLFSSPAEKDEIAAVRAAPAIPNLTEQVQKASETEWLELIAKLRHLKLLAPESRHRPDSLDAHPLVREHFGTQLKSKYPAAWREGNNRLYEYYKASAKEYPDTLEEMTLLFAAVMHGCQAGRHQEALDEVYWKRIQRENESFSKRKLGAMGAELAALSGFFESPSWSKTVDRLSEGDKGWILNGAGYDLRALGRLAEAAQSFEAGLEVRIAEKDWHNAAISANNLSELYLTLGDVKGALAYVEQSVQLADKSGVEFMR